MEGSSNGWSFYLVIMEYYVTLITECNSDHSNHDEIKSLEDDYV
jgi:hypothetical protein